MSRRTLAVDVVQKLWQGQAGEVRVDPETYDSVREVVEAIYRTDWYRCCRLVIVEHQRILYFRVAGERWRSITVVSQ